MTKRSLWAAARFNRSGFLGNAISVRCLLANCLALVVCTSTAQAQSAAPQFDGFIESLYDIQLAASEIGIIYRIDVAESDFVKKGQTIAVLDSEPQRMAVQIAMTAAAAHGTIDAAKSEHAMHSHRVEQMRQLQTEGLVRPDELIRAETDLQIAASRMLAAQEEQAMRQDELARADLQLRRRTIVAPMDGLVAKIHRRVGEFVSPTEPTIIRLLSTTDLVAVVSVPAALAIQLTSDMPIQVVTTAPRLTIPAALHSVAPVIDGESGTIKVRVKLTGNTSELRCGDRCTVQFQTSSIQQASQPIGERR